MSPNPRHFSVFLYVGIRFLWEVGENSYSLLALSIQQIRASLPSKFVVVVDKFTLPHPRRVDIDNWKRNTRKPTHHLIVPVDGLSPRGLE